MIFKQRNRGAMLHATGWWHTHAVLRAGDSLLQVDLAIAVGVHHFHRAGRSLLVHALQGPPHSVEFILRAHTASACTATDAASFVGPFVRLAPAAAAPSESRLAAALTAGGATCCSLTLGRMRSSSGSRSAASRAHVRCRSL